MTYFELLFVIFACAGDRRVPVLGWEVKSIPAAARPAAAIFGLCRAAPGSERFPSREAALARALALGPDAAPRLRACDATGCAPIALEWRPVLFVEGQEVKGGL